MSNGVPHETKPRLLVFIVAYNAERTIEDVLARIPHSLADEYHVEVLVIDDSSRDATFERGEEVRREKSLPFSLHMLYNPVNQGYGGNQKIGFHFAIERDFDFVARDRKLGKMQNLDVRQVGHAGLFFSIYR